MAAVNRERFELRFGALKIGVISLAGNDFPNEWGNIVYEPWVSRPHSPAEQRLARFVTLNKECTRLADIECKDRPSLEQDAANAEMEAEFMDIVESGQWRLVDGSGRDSPILCPVFRGETEMVWRFA